MPRPTPLARVASPRDARRWGRHTLFRHAVAAGATVPADAPRPIDLHAHTNVSDGTLSPRALVREAAARGLAALAITDHDHVGALDEARDEARALGIDIVSGIELSVEHDGVDVHLLGYLFDDRNAALLARLDALREARATRAERMVEKLAALGVPVRMDDVRAHAGAGAAIGRPHVARALIDAGHAASIQDAFDRFLSDGRPAYVPKAKLSAREAIELLHAAGGVAVIAHPVTLPEAKQESIVRAFVELGLDGLEVNHSKHAEEEEARFAAWAAALGLVATGGSDFHGENKADVLLGSGVGGNVRVDTRVLAALTQRARGRR